MSKRARSSPLEELQKRIEELENTVASLSKELQNKTEYFTKELKHLSSRFDNQDNQIKIIRDSCDNSIKITNAKLDFLADKIEPIAKDYYSHQGQTPRTGLFKKGVDLSKVKDGYGGYTIDELKGFLKNFGLARTGNKPDLAKRLKEYLEQN